MEVGATIVLFLVFIFVYLIIAEIFVMLFRFTGLTDEKARFQVISMLTNSGYTTKEAEVIVNSKKRRKLARFVMMFGYAFTVTIVSTVVNVFLQFKHTFIGSAMAFIPLILVIVIVIWFVKKNKWTNKIIESFIRSIANKIMYNQDSNSIIILDDYGDLVISEIELKIMPKELEGKALIESNIKSEFGLNILLKKTGKQEILPVADTTFDINDILVVMGNERKIRKIFEISR